MTAVVEDIFDAPEDADFLRVFRANHFPRTTENDPVIRSFDLVTVHKRLPEKSKLIIDSVAQRGVIHRRERIEEARGKTAETAITKPHINFGLADFFKILPQAFERGVGRIEQTRGQEVIAEESAHEVLERKIINAAHVLGVVHGLRRDHALMNRIPHRQRGRDPPVTRRGRGGMPRQRRGEMPQNQSPETRLAHAGIRTRSARRTSGSSAR